MTTPDDPTAQLSNRLLTFADSQFYDLELTVLEQLRSSGNDRCVTAACKDYNVDPYDFKDRWGPLLRNHPPSEVLQNILAIKPRLGQPVHDIAKALNLSFATVRTIVKKLQMGPTSKHKRTKENLAHRMISTSGVSLKEAKASLGSRRKQKAGKKEGNEDDSLYSSDEESGSESSDDNSPTPKEPVKRDRSLPAVEKPPQKRPTIAPITPRTQSWYDQTTKLLAGLEAYSTEIKQQPITPETQLRILGDIARGNPLPKACISNGIEELTFRSMWQPLLKLIPAYHLDATVFVIVSLTKLGYGSCKIAEAVGVTRSFVNQVLSNLNLELGPSDCRTFDVTILLINRETLTAQQISDLCKAQAEMGKRVVRRSTCRQQYLEKLAEETGEVDVAEGVMWLYERGFSVEVICTVLRVPRGMVKVLPIDED